MNDQAKIDQENPICQKCQSCESELIGDYCHICGEKRMDDGQRKLSLLFGQLIDSLFSIDGKLNRSFFSILFRPGFLSYEHWRGKRNPYMRPIALFFILNVIYFFFVPVTDFSLSFNDQKIQPYSDIVFANIESKISIGILDEAQIEKEYDAIKDIVSKSFLFLAIPLLVPFVWLVNASKKYYLIDHVVFSIHIYTFVLIWPLLIHIIRVVLNWFGLLSLMPQSLMLGVMLMAYYTYSFLAQRSMYRSKIFISALKSAFILFGIIISHFTYRFIQFSIIWWQIT